MTRRRSVRRLRRVQVQFWRRGELQSYPGYTTNISTTGMFLATNSPQPPGTRLRIEVMNGDQSFILEGVVAHARKVRGDMVRLSHPGMGIRFLSVAEMVRELIPVMPGDTEEIPETERDWGQALQREPAPEPASFIPQPEAPPPAPPVPAPPVRSEPIPRSVDGAGAFNVQFLGPAELVEVFQRDILQGGLFVSTRYPGRLQEIVKIDLLPPVPDAEPVSFRARVVQRFEPQGSDSSPNLLSGMGVEILDLSTVVDRLRPLVERLKAAL
jgi:hypothetical protein